MNLVSSYPQCLQSNLQTGYYLTTLNGSNIIMDYKGNGSPFINQKWFLKYFPNSNATAIVSLSTVGSKQFALDGGAMTAGSQLQLSEFNSTSPKPSQQWIQNGYCWQLANHNLVMDVARGNRTAGTPVILSMVNNPPSPSRQFTLIVRFIIIGGEKVEGRFGACCYTKAKAQP